MIDKDRGKEEDKTWRVKAASSDETLQAPFISNAQALAACSNISLLEIPMRPLGRTGQKSLEAAGKLNARTRGQRRFGATQRLSLPSFCQLEHISPSNKASLLICRSTTRSPQDHGFVLELARKIPYSFQKYVMVSPSYPSCLERIKAVCRRLGRSWCALTGSGRRSRKERDAKQSRWQSLFPGRGRLHHARRGRALPPGRKLAEAFEVHLWRLDLLAANKFLN